MRKITRVAMFAVVTLLLVEASARALEPALPELTGWREPIVAAKVAQMDGLGATDVVFAGSSQMLFAGDPSMLKRLKVGWSAYNAGLWGAPPVVNEHWLTEVVAPRLHPKTIVLGESPVDFIEADTDLAISTYFSSTAVRKGWLGAVERTVVGRSAFIRNRKTLRSPTSVFDAVGRKLSNEQGPAIPKTGIDAVGRLPLRDAMTFRGDAYAKELIAGVVRRGWVVSPPQLEAFRRTVEALRDDGIEVLVADMAISQPMIDLLGKDGYKSYRTFLRHEAHVLGVPLLDMAAGVADTRFFIDYDHVNRAGANVFNTVLARALQPGTAGGFVPGLRPMASKPLATVLASDVIEREAAKAPAPPPGPDVPPAPAPPAAPSPSVAPVATPTAPPIDTPVRPPVVKVGP